MRSRTGFLPALSVLALALTGTLVSAQGVDSRVASVHFEDVVESSPAFAEASAQWSVRLSELTAGIQSLQDEFEAADERLTTSDPPLSGDARTELVASMERLQVEIERRRGEVEPDLTALRDALLRPVVEEVQAAATDLARLRGFDILIDSSSALLGFVLVAEEVDLTDELIESLGGSLPDQAAPADPSDPAIPLLPENPPPDTLGLDP